jgi:hypothetical protein
MRIPIRARCVAWSLAAAVAGGCASVAPESRPEPPPVSGVNHEASGTAFRVTDLHMLNIGEVRQLQKFLQQRISSDVLALSALLQHYKLSTDERARLQRLMTLIAIQNEKFPVPEWRSDGQVMAALNAALSENPEYANELRARNWSKPMWQR